MKTCSIEGCEKPQRRRDWCGMHHTRFLRHGDPLVARPRFSDPEKSFAERVAWDGGCLIWIGATSSKGYGKIFSGGRMVGVHRYAWEREHGPIPEGMVIDHSCWNRACVDVEHLRLATYSQNNAYQQGASAGKDLPRGVYRTRNGKRFTAQVASGGIGYYVGTFDSEAEALIAAAVKRSELFGEFAGV